MLQALKNFYTRYEGLVGGATLIGGFIFDNLTLRDATIKTQTTVFLIYIVLGGIAIMVLHLLESIETKKYPKTHFWFFILLQFSLGSLFSMFFVFYSRGVAITTSWPFLFLLFGNMIGSELFKKHYSRLSLQVSLYFIAIFSFCLYLVPIITHTLSTLTFLLSGVLSLIFVFLFVRLLVVVSPKRVEEWQKRIIYGVGFVYLLLNIFYFTGVIPPVPLVMRQAGVYHTLQWDGISKYLVTKETKPWWNMFVPYPSFSHAPNDSVYVMAAVYAPAALETTIVHEWDHYNGDKHTWEDVAKIRVPIVGGREDGYRTYSMRQDFDPGLWRVDVKTASGQTIGRIRFKIVEGSAVPELVGEEY